MYLAVEPTPGMAGGDLLLTFDPALGHPLAASVDGLPGDALSTINTQTPGQLRLSFAGSGKDRPDTPLTLRLLLPAPSSGTPLQIDLSGRLFDETGNHLGNLQLEQEPGSARPSTYALLPNHPNPFNPRTAIRYALPEPGEVSLRVYNLTGQRVRTLVQGQMEPGHHTVEWDGRDEAGNRAGSGVYLYRLVVDGGRYSETRRMLLLK